MTEAAGLRVPSTVGDFLVLEAISASGGTAIAIPEAELTKTQRFAARLGAGFLSLESAAVFASLPQLRSQGAIGPDDTVVAFDTGAGFKSKLPEVPPRRAVSANDADWEPLLRSYAPA